MQKRSVEVRLSNSESNEVIGLRIHLLPKTNPDDKPFPLFEREDEPDDGLERVQLLEAKEYRYELVSDRPSLQLEPSRLFKPDDDSGLRGRISVEFAVGAVEITALSGDKTIGKGWIEVRSQKLDYLSDYQIMLQDLAEVFGETLLQSFAPSQQWLNVDNYRDSESLYQRFSFLKHLLSGDEFGASMERILRQPSSKASTIETPQDPRAGVHGGSWLSRAISRPGPRLDHSALPIPVRLMVPRTEETRDTNSNRFIKFALRSWGAEAVRVQTIFEKCPDSLTGRRALSETREVIQHLDELLAREFFRDVGDDYRPNVPDQVLLRSEGYRNVFRIFAQSRLAAQLSWRGGESVYAAGKRDVATLYEYWTFIQLARALERATGTSISLGSLVTQTEEGLTLKLKRGTACKLSIRTGRAKRVMSVELNFNQTFSHKHPPESWSFPMRPDFSIRIQSESDELGRATGEVWLHFDSKYSADEIVAAWDKELSGEALPSTNEKDLIATRADFLKMHTYRDAIRRTAGAYILYPGTKEPKTPQEYHELLPGLGAFPLRPTKSGEPAGLDAIAGFIGDVLNHLSSQSTQHERSRFWENETFRDRIPPKPSYLVLPQLKRPPADTLVLIGYVKDRNHLAWIERNGLYNLRASGRRGSVQLGARELSCEFALLYGPELNFAEIRPLVGAPVVMNEGRMRSAGYPSPDGDYLCLQIGEAIPEMHRAIITADLELRLELKAPEIVGAPITRTWAELEPLISASK